MRWILFIVLLVGIAGVCTAQTRRYIEYTDSKGIERRIAIDLPEITIAPAAIEIKRPNGRLEGHFLYLGEELWLAGLYGGISAVYDGVGNFLVATPQRNDPEHDRASIKYENGKLTGLYSRREDESIEARIDYEDDVLQRVRTERPDGSVEAAIGYVNGRIGVIAAAGRDGKPQAAISYAGGYPACGP